MMKVRVGEKGPWKPLGWQLKIFGKKIPLCMTKFGRSYSSCKGTVVWII
jgi:hypothetical protein